jgi:hypothetical protein
MTLPRDEEHQGEEIIEDSDSESEALVMDGLGMNVGKIAELQKKKRQTTAQYTRALKQWDDNVCKHICRSYRKRKL